jgi:tetratricopeptide (TPR) repeat protein
MTPDEVDSILEQASELLEAGKAAETLACLRPLDDGLVEAEHRIEHGSLKSWALTELGRHDEAIRLLEPLVEEFPESSRLLGSLGVALSNAGDLEDAADALEHAVECDETNNSALANLGVVYERLRDYRRAMEMYDKAQEQGADIDWLLQRKATVQSEMGDVKAAKSSLRRYLSLAPEDAAEWVSLAILHSDENEFDRAFQCYRQAEQISPESASLRLNWGVTAVRAGDLNAAREQLRLLERLEPGQSRPLLLKSFILEESKNLEGALEHYDRAIAVARPDDADDLGYALEMAMDFAARHRLADRCEELFALAYASNVCSVELCEAYREAVGPPLESGAWYSAMVEADYRPGLVEVPDRDQPSDARFSRYLRNYQVVAADRDDAIAALTDLLKKMGERRTAVREFIGEEPISDTHAGVYEIERESLVFGNDDKRK